MYDNSDRVAAAIAPRHGDKPRDPLTGRLLEHLTQQQLDAVLERYPSLREFAPELPDPNTRLKWDAPSYFNGLRVVTPEDARRELARSAALLKDPITPVQRREPTKPAPALAPQARRELSFDRKWQASQHESAHICVALLLNRHVADASIGHQDGSDGRVNYRLSDHPGINACVSLAGQVWDKIIGDYRPDEYTTDNKHVLEDIGNNPEYRAALKAKVRDYLLDASPAVIKVARALLTKEKLSAFDVKSAFLRGMRKARHEARSAPMSQQKGRVLSQAEMQERFGRDLIGYASGYIVGGSLQ